VLGPPQMSFASSLHSPPLRKSTNRDSILSSARNRSSPPNDDAALPASPPDDDEEAGWSKVRSGARGNTSRGFERRAMRGERRGGRDSYEGLPSKNTSFRNNREGESQNWRSERLEPASVDQTRNDTQEHPEFLEDDGEFGGAGNGGREHSAEEFQAWITKMRGGNVKSEERIEAQNEPNLQNGTSIGIFLLSL
jgi:hypothetical protein